MSGGRDNPARSATATRTVLTGGSAWLIALVALRPGWPEAMLLLAALVAVPLGLGSVAPPDIHDRRAWAWRAAVRLQIPAALTLAAAFARPAGAVAACLALPWLTVTGLVALCGLARFRRGPRDLAETCLDAGQVDLAVGGTWAVIARAGLRPLGFPDVIVAMTAVHFHYAGFALAVLAGLVARATGGAAAGAACLGVIAGVPLVAGGIAEAQLGTGLLPPRMLELVASGLMAASGILVGGLQVRLAARPGRPASARLLLALSGVAVLGPMSLAVAYALGGFTNVVWITIPEMFRYHGAVNALGFALPGLLAWSLMGMEVRPSTRRKHGPGREANPNMKIPRDPDPDEGPGRNRPGLARGEVITEGQRIRPIGPTDQPRKIIASLGEMILCPDVFLLYYSQLRTRGRHPSHHDRSSGHGLPA